MPDIFKNDEIFLTQNASVRDVERTHNSNINFDAAEKLAAANNLTARELLNRPEFAGKVKIQRKYAEYDPANRDTWEGTFYDRAELANKRGQTLSADELAWARGQFGASADAALATVALNNGTAFHHLSNEQREALLNTHGKQSNWAQFARDQKRRYLGLDKILSAAKTNKAQNDALQDSIFDAVTGFFGDNSSQNAQKLEAKQQNMAAAMRELGYEAAFNGAGDVFVRRAGSNSNFHQFTQDDLNSFWEMIKANKAAIGLGAVSAVAAIATGGGSLLASGAAAAARASIGAIAKRALGSFLRFNRNSYIAAPALFETLGAAADRRINLASTNQNETAAQTAAGALKAGAVAAGAGAIVKGGSQLIKGYKFARNLSNQATTALQNPAQTFEQVGTGLASRAASLPFIPAVGNIKNFIQGNKNFATREFGLTSEGLARAEAHGGGVELTGGGSRNLVDSAFINELKNTDNEAFLKEAISGIKSSTQNAGIAHNAARLVTDAQAQADIIVAELGGDAADIGAALAKSKEAARTDYGDALAVFSRDNGFGEVSGDKLAATIQARLAAWAENNLTPPEIETAVSFLQRELAGQQVGFKKARDIEKYINSKFENERVGAFLNTLRNDVKWLYDDIIATHPDEAIRAKASELIAQANRDFSDAASVFSHKEFKALGDALHDPKATAKEFDKLAEVAKSERGGETIARILSRTDTNTRETLEAGILNSVLRSAKIKVANVGGKILDGATLSRELAELQKTLPLSERSQSWIKNINEWCIANRNTARIAQAISTPSTAEVNAALSTDPTRSMSIQLTGRAIHHFLATTEHHGVFHRIGKAVNLGQKINNAVSSEFATRALKKYAGTSALKNTAPTLAPTSAPTATRTKIDELNALLRANRRPPTDPTPPTNPTPPTAPTSPRPSEPTTPPSSPTSPAPTSLNPTTPRTPNPTTPPTSPRPSDPTPAQTPTPDTTVPSAAAHTPAPAQKLTPAPKQAEAPTPAPETQTPALTPAREKWADVQLTAQDYREARRNGRSIDEQKRVKFERANRRERLLARRVNAEEAAAAIRFFDALTPDERAVIKSHLVGRLERTSADLKRKYIKGTYSPRGSYIAPNGERVFYGASGTPNDDVFAVTRGNVDRLLRALDNPQAFAHELNRGDIAALKDDISKIIQGGYEGSETLSAGFITRLKASYNDFAYADEAARVNDEWAYYLQREIARANGEPIPPEFARPAAPQNVREWNDLYDNIDTSLEAERAKLAERYSAAAKDDPQAEEEWAWLYEKLDERYDTIRANVHKGFEEWLQSQPASIKAQANIYLDNEKAQWAKLAADEAAAKTSAASAKPAASETTTAPNSNLRQAVAKVAPAIKARAAAHIGTGLASATAAGFERDENGNFTGIDPAKFVAGFIAGVAGTAAAKAALKSPAARAAAENFIKKSGENIREALLNSNLDVAARRAVEMALGKKLTRMLDTRLYIMEPDQAVNIVKKRSKNAVAQEKLALKGVIYDGKDAAVIYKDLEALDEAILLEKGNKNYGGDHIRIRHTQSTKQQGYVTKREVANIGQNVRKYLNEFEPFDDGRARIYEWRDGGVDFRLVVRETGSGDRVPPSASETIITFYSNRNLKDGVKFNFKNPAISQKYDPRYERASYNEYIGISGRGNTDMHVKGTRPLAYFTQDDLNFIKEKMGLKSISRADFENFLKTKGAAIEKDPHSEYFGEHTWHHAQMPRRYIVAGETHITYSHVGEAYFYSVEDAILNSTAQEIKAFFGSTPAGFTRNQKRIAGEIAEYLKIHDNVENARNYGQAYERAIFDGKSELEAGQIATQKTQEFITRRLKSRKRDQANEQKHTKAVRARTTKNGETFNEKDEIERELEARAKAGTASANLNLVAPAAASSRASQAAAKVAPAPEPTAPRETIFTRD